MLKKCNGCGQELPLDNFGKDSARKDGVSNKCKACVKVKNKQAYDNNAEKRREYAKQYREGHLEEKAEYNRKYREANAEQLNQYLKDWRAKNPGYKRSKEAYIRELERRKKAYAEDPEYKAKQQEKLRRYRAANPEKVAAALRKYREANLERMREYARRYVQNRRASDPEFKENLRRYQKIRRLKNWHPTDEGYVRGTGTGTVDMAVINRLHAWQMNYCYVCNAPMPKGGSTVEHIVPRSIGGPGVAQNIVLSCPRCNLSRQNKLLNVQWFPEKIEELPPEAFYVSQKRVAEGLAEGGVEADADGFGFVLHGHNERKLFVLSSFAASERNPYSEKFAVRLKAEHPDAIVLFDFDWYARRQNVLNMLKAKLGVASRAGARTMSVSLIDAAEARPFLDLHHVMGFGVGNYYVVLKDSTGELFGVGVFALRNEGAEWIRLAFKGHVPGGMSKILEHFWKSAGRLPIVSYVDSRYADGGGHEAIGFQYLGLTPATHKWLFPDRVQHYRYLSNENKMLRNLIFYNPEYDRHMNIAANGVNKLFVPPLHKILLEP